MPQRTRSIDAGGTSILSAGAVAAVAALVVFLLVTGRLGMTTPDFATWIAYGIVLLSILFFAYLIFGALGATLLLILFTALSAALVPGMGIEGGQWAAVGTLSTFVGMCVWLLGFRGDTVTIDQKHLMVIFWLFLLAAVFWAGFEQSGSSMNLFADRDTDRFIFGFEIPTGWLQNVNPFFVVVLAPVFGLLVDLARVPRQEPVDAAEVRARPDGPGGGPARFGLGRVVRV